MRGPSGIGLLLTGSGIYWVLSSQLIASFTALAPELFRHTAQGMTLVLVVGVLCTLIGLWIVPDDLDELVELFSRSDGWLFTIPLSLVAADLHLTLIGLSADSRSVELNPFVNSAVQTGTVAVVPFIVSYMALSQGVALMMLDVGRRLFGSSGPWRFLPFSAVCGAASFGPFSNLALLANLSIPWLGYLLGAVGSVILAALVFLHFRKREYPAPTNIS